MGKRTLKNLTIMGAGAGLVSCSPLTHRTVINTDIPDLKKTTEVKYNAPVNPYAPMYVEQLLKQAELYPTKAIKEHYSPKEIAHKEPVADALEYGNYGKGPYWIVSSENGTPSKTLIVYSQEDLKTLFLSELKKREFYEKLKKGNAVNVNELQKLLSENVGLYEKGGEVHYLMFITPKGYVNVAVMDREKDGKMPLEGISFAAGKGFKGLQDAYISALSILPSDHLADTKILAYEIDSKSIRQTLTTTASVFPYIFLPGVGAKILGVNLAQYFVSEMFSSNPNNIAAALYAETISKCYTTELGAVVAGQSKLKRLLGEDPKNIYHYVLTLPNHGVVLVSSTFPYCVKKTEKGVYVFEYAKNLGFQTAEEVFSRLIEESIKVWGIKKFVDHETKHTSPSSGSSAEAPATPSPEESNEPPVIPYPSQPDGLFGPGSAPAIEGPVFNTSFIFEELPNDIHVARSINHFIEEGRPFSFDGLNGAIYTLPGAQAISKYHGEDLAMISKADEEKIPEELKTSSVEWMIEDFANDPEKTYHYIVKSV